MKWFKHQANARNDERLSRLEDKAGLEGYGFYFKMLEIVAEVIDATDRHEVTYSLSRWGRQANISTKKFVFLVQCCHDVGLMIAQRVDDDMIVKIPNLLKYRDNHTKNLQATSKQDLEVEIDKEREEESKAIAPKSQKKSFSPDSMQAGCAGLTPAIANEYFQYRKQKHAPLTPSSWKLIVSEIALTGMTPDAALAEAMAAGWQGLKATWLANRNQPRSGAPPQSIHEKRANTIAELTGANKHEQHNERDITGESVRVAG